MDHTFEEWRDLIPEEFRQGDGHPLVYTVGDLVAQLSRLPQELPVSATGRNGALMVVYGVSENYLDPHLVFEDNNQVDGFWDDDDEDWMELVDDDEDDCEEDDDDDWDDDDEDW